MHRIMLTILLLGYAFVAKCQQEDSNYVYEFFQTQVKASFPGGENALRRYVNDSIKNQMIVDSSCAIVLTVIIERDGSIDSIVANHNTCSIRNLEAQVYAKFRSMPRWSPATIRNKTVRMRMQIPMRFYLN